MLPLKQAPNTAIFIKASKTVARNIYKTYEIHNQCPQLMRQIQCPQFTKMGKFGGKNVQKTVIDNAAIISRRNYCNSSGGCDETGSADVMTSYVNKKRDWLSEQR